MNFWIFNRPYFQICSIDEIYRLPYPFEARVMLTNSVRFNHISLFHSPVKPFYRKVTCLWWCESRPISYYFDHSSPGERYTFTPGAESNRSCPTGATHTCKISLAAVSPHGLSLCVKHSHRVELCCQSSCSPR